MAKLTIVAEIDLDSDESTDQLATVSDILTDWIEACDAGQPGAFAKASGIFKIDPEDEDEDSFGTWKWE